MTIRPTLTQTFNSSVSKCQVLFYLSGYPMNTEHKTWSNNLLFYRNSYQIPSLRRMLCTDDMFSRTFAEHNSNLESLHQVTNVPRPLSDEASHFVRTIVPDEPLDLQCIQRHWTNKDGGWGLSRLLDEPRAHALLSEWLFPIRESTMFVGSHPLQKHEATAIAEDVQLQESVMRSFNLLLSCFGLHVTYNPTDVVCPPAAAAATAASAADLSVDDGSKREGIRRDESIAHRSPDWARCYERTMAHPDKGKSQLHRSALTRALKFLGEVGLEKHTYSLRKLLVMDVSGGCAPISTTQTKAKDQHPVTQPPLRACRDELVDYWVPLIRDAQERRRLEEMRLVLIAESDPTMEGELCNVVWNESSPSSPVERWMRSQKRYRF